VGRNLVQRGEDALVDGQIILDPVAILVDLGRQWPIPGLHRVGTPGYLDDGRTVEMLGKALQVNGRRSDDDLQIRPPRQQSLEEAQQEIDVQRTLVGLVDDDGVVTLEEAIVLRLGQQDAVGHQLDQRAVLALILEAHLITHQLAEWRADFLGHPRGDAACRQPARLRMANQPVHATADLQADLR